ncbi:MAG: hypothetical protein JNL62_21945 [Bryobacterales bacterium]|nr:hypothetical protein [Bryobacterales bacterium]
MIINASYATIRAHAKRAGFFEALMIRTGRRAMRAELEHVPDGSCSVRIAVAKPRVEDYLAALADRYGSL